MYKQRHTSALYLLSIHCKRNRIRGRTNERARAAAGRDIPKQFILPTILPRSSSPYAGRWGGRPFRLNITASTSPSTTSHCRPHPQRRASFLISAFGSAWELLPNGGIEREPSTAAGGTKRLHSLLPSHTSHLIVRQRAFTPCARPFSLPLFSDRAIIVEWYH